MKKINNKSIYSLLLILSLTLTGCDMYNPKTSFRIAVPENDHSYMASSQHLASFLKKGKFDVEIIHTKNAIEANQLVAEGKADLTFIMNHSNFIPEELGNEAGKLRTICPMFQRLFFLFSKHTITDLQNTRELIEEKKIGIEVLYGETHSNLSNMLKSGKMDNVKIVPRNEESDLVHFWGTFYGLRATKLLETGWKEISLSPSWINFITLNNPALSPYILPAIPGLEGSENINTVSTETLLVGNSELGEQAIYKLSSYIYKNRLELMKYDIMYRSINENFDVTNLLYPLHKGADAYLRRLQPTFMERNADIVALIISIGAILYGVIQAIRSRISRKKKERIDLYFLEFLDIKSEKYSKDKRIQLLDDLLQRSVLQMTSEKMDKNDFHIFTRLLQQELSNLRFGV